MIRRYTLLRSVVGFSTNDRRVVAIPAGALITVMMRQSCVGIISTVFEGQNLLVASEDIEQNGISAEIQ
jgi:hypothetical protein